MLSIERISNIKKLRDINGFWNQALKASNSNSLFLSYEWIYHWWESFGKDNELLILVVKDNNTVIGIAPLMLEEYKIGKLTFKQITFIQNAHCYYLDFIITKKANEVIEIIFQYLKREIKNWRRIYLIRIPTSSTNIEIIRDCCDKMYLFKNQYGGISPYIPIDGEWKEYYAKRSRNTRKQIKKYWRLLSQQDKIEFKMYKKSLDIHMAIKELFEIDKTSWQGKNQSGMSSTPSLRKFYTEIIKNATKKDQLILTIMYLNDKPISYLLGINYNDILWLLKMGYNPRFSNYSVGHHTCNYLLEHCFKELKVSKCELLGTKFTLFKRRYTDIGQEFHNFIIYRKTLLNYVYFILRKQIRRFNKTATFFPKEPGGGKT